MEDYEEIDFAALFRKLVHEWRFILKCCAVAFVIGIIAALSLVSTFTVTAKISPESTGKTSSGSLNSIASLAGINIGNLTTSDAISPELYPDIVASVPFMTTLFEMPVEAEYKGEAINCNYYEYAVNCRRTPWYSYVISLPFKAVSAIGGLFNRDEKDSVKGFKELGEVDNAHLTKQQSRVVTGMRRNVKVVTDKKTRVVTLSVTDQNPVIAKQLSDAIIDNIRVHITEYRTEKARKDLAYYEQLYSESQKEYYDAQRKYANYVDKNQGITLRSVMIEQERLQNEAQLKYQLYNSCAQQVQLAKAQVQRETPVCVVITPPTVPLRDNESGVKTLLIFVLLGLVLASFWVLCGRDWIQKLKKAEQQ